MEEDKVKDYISSLDKKVSYFQRLWFHKWLRWEIILNSEKRIYEDIFKSFLGYKVEEPFHITSEYTKDLMDYVSGEEVLSDGENYERKINFDEAYDYYNTIENKNLTTEDLKLMLKRIDHVKLKSRKYTSREIKDENIIFIYNLYNILLDNRNFKHFESKVPIVANITKEKWLKNAKILKRKLGFLLVDALMRICKDESKFEEIIYKIWRHLTHRYSFLKQIYRKIVEIKHDKEIKHARDSEISLLVSEIINQSETEESNAISEKEKQKSIHITDEINEELKEEVGLISESIYNQNEQQIDDRKANRIARFIRDCNKQLNQWLNNKIEK